MNKFIFIYIFIGIQLLGATEFLDGGSRLSQKTRWVQFSSSEHLNLKHLLIYLSKSQTGRELIRNANKKAKSYGLTLYDVIKPGAGSITDTTLIRKFSQHDPNKISYESRSKVYINNQLNQYDALLDLAHELTHFVHRKTFNPYNTKFTLPKFIESTVEGEGGEVHAFMTECRVLNELFPKRLQERYNCKKIISTDTGKISKKLAVEKFYSVGSYYANFKHKLDLHGIGESFPYISKNEIGFVSSAYGMPYPIAAYHEFKSVLSKVCENDKRRISYMKVGNRGRTIASISKAKKDYLDKCSSVETL